MGRITHGMTASFEYGVWCAMRKRCTYEKHPKYHRYGGRGITVCARWGSFEAFYADMGACPFPNGSIERKNSDDGYTPENCVWLPKGEQSRNRMGVHVVNGHTLPELALMYGLKYSTLLRRANAGWDEARMFKQPTELGTRKLKE